MRSQAGDFLVGFQPNSAKPSPCRRGLFSVPPRSYPTGDGIDQKAVWPYHTDMATTSVKTTYSLDVDTVRKLEAIASRWKVSKSEALRRAIRAAATGGAPAKSDATRALDELQSSLGLTASVARRWERSSRAERQQMFQRINKK